jgi:hypothetical protein
MKISRNILFIILMALLIMPAFQELTGIFPEKPLKGAIEKPQRPELNLKSWFDASFQEKYDDYLEQGIGFRPTFIRINNQIAFSLFDTALANGVIIGKNNYLYEINYVKAYCGLDFIGDSSIRAQVIKARKFQDELQQQGKHFLMIFTPGKASFFPEHFPSAYQALPKKPTNYQSFIKACKELGVNYIDFNEWFLSMKAKSPYPLYSKTGIHWSLYGVSLAVDSLVGYMEKAANINMVDFGWDGVDISSTPHDTDSDIADGMNLLFPVRPGKLAYPRIYFNDSPEQVKPSVIVVGDSYYWNIMGSGISSRLFKNNEFWFYNQEAHNPGWQAPKKMSEINRLEAISKQDFIILLSTEANLNRFPFGFFEDLEKEKSTASRPKMNPEEREKQIKEIMAKMKGSAETMQLIRKKAQDKKVSVEEMIRLDAEWVYENTKAGK